MCDILSAFKHCAKEVTESTRYFLIGEFLDGLSDEWTSIIGQKFIHFKDVIDWLYDGHLSKKQLEAKYSAEKKKAVTQKDPFFEQGTHWCLFTPTGTKEKQMYLTTEGVTYWSMGQQTTKSNLVRYYISRRHVRSIVSKASPIKKRKLLRIMKTPQRKKLKSHSSGSVEHPDLQEAIAELKRIQEKNSQVYFIWDGNAMKIGLTRQGAEKRIKNLQTGNSSDLEIYRTIQTPNPNQLEKFLHDVFQDKHVRGEWYDVTKEEIGKLVEFLEGV